MCTSFIEKIELILSKLKRCYVILLLLFLLAVTAKQLLLVYPTHDTEEHFGIFIRHRMLKNIAQPYPYEEKKKEPACPVVFGSI